MSNTNDTNKPGGRRPLTLKKSGPGTVRQNFSGGRSKSVVVEKKKRRIIGGPGKPTPSAGATPAAPTKQVDEIAEAARKLGLSKAEYVKRQQAVTKAVAKQDEREEARRAEEAERKRRMEEEKAALEAKKKAEDAQRGEAGKDLSVERIKFLFKTQNSVKHDPLVTKINELLLSENLDKEVNSPKIYWGKNFHTSSNPSRKRYA